MKKINLFKNLNYEDYLSKNPIHELDQHFFELVEEPLGIYNNDYINFALGADWFSDNDINFSNK